jgi:toxin ParE1/3/4
MIGYKLLIPAEEEMIEASLFYEMQSNGLGEDFLDDVQRTIDLVREHPRLGHAVGRGLRRMVLHRFPFNLLYSEVADTILVVAVAHHKRRPSYWSNRLR